MAKMDPMRKRARGMVEKGVLALGPEKMKKGSANTKRSEMQNARPMGFKKGGKVKMAAGGVAKIRHNEANKDGSPRNIPRKRR